MKKIVIPFVAVLLLLASSCSEKFKVSASYKDITVVYGFLDVNDTAHYIRIQKAFLDENKNALTMAQTPDSNFYANLNVKIERLSYPDLNHVFDTIHLTRVDLDLEGYPKPAGQFFNSPNYAYKFKNTLDPQYLYRLVITNLTTGRVDSADAPIIDDSSPLHFYVDALDTSLKGMLDFSSTLGDKYFEIFGSYGPVSNFSFEGLGSPVQIGQTIIRFNWDDSDATSHLHTPRSHDFNVGFFYPDAHNNFDVKINNTTMYSAVAAALDPAPANTFRLMDRCDIFVYLSTNDFNSYLQTTITQGTGLTGAEIEPIYTNVKGASVVGLFTSRGMRTGKITMTNVTIDSLESSALLSSAHVAGTVYH